jgi:hypothetical protein
MVDFIVLIFSIFVFKSFQFIFFPEIPMSKCLVCHGRMYRVLILSDNYSLSLPTATLLHMWAVD